MIKFHSRSCFASFRQLILNFNQRYSERILQYSLRGQIINDYNGILALLQQFPNIRETYFILGEPNEKKTEPDGVQSLQADPRCVLNVVVWKSSIVLSFEF